MGRNPEKSVRHVITTIARVVSCTSLLATMPSAYGHASTVVVPDDVASVQAAIDSYADTVLVRSGAYDELAIVDHALVLRGVGESSPSIPGMHINNVNFVESRTLSVAGIHFTGPVTSAPGAVHPRNLVIGFEDCVLGSGFSQLYSHDPLDIGNLSFVRCRLTGSSRARAGTVTMDADTVLGGVAWSTTGIDITKCHFLGGAGRAIELTDAPQGAVSDNTIQNYAVGVYAEGLMRYTFSDNTIHNCGTGLALWSGRATITGNSIYNCGIGIFGVGRYTVTSNTVMRASAYGMHFVGAEALRAEHNVLGYGASDGILLESTDTPTVRNNTFVRNSGSGIRLQNHYAGDIVLANNIGYQNRRWGLEATPPIAFASTCNDWFGNTLGATTGSGAGGTDVAIDPQFCDVDSGDVGLQTGSPLADYAGCGQIGAKGETCGVTATLLTMFYVESATSGAVLLTWRFGGISPSMFWIERSATAGESWDRLLGTPEVVSGNYKQWDEVAQLAGSYRLSWIDDDGQTRHSESVSVAEYDAVPDVVVSPNPSYGNAVLTWSMPAAGHVDVGVFDLGGRRIATQMRGSALRGRHTLMWNGRTTAGDLAAPGWYLVRVRYNDVVATRRLLLVR